MNGLWPDHVSVKTDAHARPLCFAWCEDSGTDDSIVIDGWLSSSNADGGVSEEWIVRSTQGNIYELQRGDNATGQGVGEVWTARRARSGSR